jgi:hypothetical protein
MSSIISKSGDGLLPIFPIAAGWFRRRWSENNGPFGFGLDPLASSEAGKKQTRDERGALEANLSLIIP